MLPIFTNPKGRTMIVRAMQPRLLAGRGPMSWPLLEEDSHLQEAQDKIRQAIRRGQIRVLPGEAGRIKIIPLPGSEAPRPPRAS